MSERRPQMSLCRCVSVSVLRTSKRKQNVCGAILSLVGKFADMSNQSSLMRFLMQEHEREVQHARQIKELIRLGNILRAEPGFDEVLNQIVAAISTCTGFSYSRDKPDLRGWRTSLIGRFRGCIS